MKAYLIARVSTEEQEDALPAQVYRLQDYAQRNRFSPLLFQLQESAFKDNRHQFAGIVAQIAAEKEKVVVVFDKIDRYSRDVSSDVTRALRQLCKSDKIEIHFPSDYLEIKATSPAQVWFMLTIGEATAENYSRSVGDNVRRRFDQKLRDGTILGRAPMGYNNITRPDGSKWVEIDTLKAEIVKDIFNEYATGVSSFKLIRDKIIQKYGVTFSRSKIEQTLKNPFYRGEMLYKGKLSAHHYERFITDELFERARQVREGYQVKPFIYAGLPYTYRSLISCAECGCRITFEKKKGKYVYGHCTQTKGKHGAAYVPESYFTQKFSEIIQSIVIPEEVYRSVSASLREEAEAERKTEQVRLSEVDAEILKYEKRIERLVDEHLDERIPDHIYEKKLTEFNAAQQVLRNRRDKFELVSKDDFSSADHLLKLAKNAQNLFEKGKIEQKRALLKMLHSNLELDGNLLRWKLKKPFELMAFGNVSGNWLRLLGSNQRHPR